MLRRIWQSVMIALARSGRLTGLVQGTSVLASLSRRYVAGGDAAAGMRRARDLAAADGIRASLFFLGEYVEDRGKIAEAVENKLAVAGELAEAGLDIHVSVDPTQIGGSLDDALMDANADAIAARIGVLAGPPGGVHCMMIDMEDHSVVDKTIALHDRLQAAGYPVALTLQAYLRRTEADIARLVERPSRVRLVKGAFVAAGDIAFTSQAEIKANYRRLIDLMFSPAARASGFYPIIATHDDRLHAHARDVARRNGWPEGTYEFEMLMGVRGDVAGALAAAGERVRLYVPFGRDWWPYAIRRIGENPRNALLLARSLVS
ncbi:MAG TPA: proline dehydrogenase family protein [Hyphomicrobiales bacterium]|nr:proline dehydrogenase family protein [Hyphomicrobiales bacterium]